MLEPQTRFGRELRKLRLKLGLSQRQFAQKMGAAHNQISAWETGDAVPGKRLIEQLNKAYGVNAFNWLSDSTPSTSSTLPSNSRFYLVQVNDLTKEKVEGLVINHVKQQAQGGKYEFAG